MSTNARLDDLLFEEDDSGDETTPIGTDVLGTTAAMPSTIATPSPVPTPPVSMATGTKSISAAEVVGKMFGMLRRMLSPDMFAKLRVEVNQCNNDVKRMLLVVKKIAGDDVFNAVLREIRNPAAVAGASNPPMSTSSIGSVPSSMSSNPLAKYMPSSGSTAAIPPPTDITSDTSARSTNPPRSTASGQSRSGGGSSQMRAYIKLLEHAVQCKIPVGCTVQRCTDLKNMISHCAKCPTRSTCTTCMRLTPIIKQHAMGCSIPVTTRCPIPFCDHLRKRLAQSRGDGAKSASSMSKPPISQLAHSKPMAPVSTASTGGNPGPQTAPKGQSQAQIYGEYLRIILHAQQCNLDPCPLGNKCKECKELIKIMDQPDAPPRAKAYRTVMQHHQTCKIRNTCQVCTVGMQPFPMNAAHGIKREMLREPPGSAKKQKSRPSSSSLLGKEAIGTTSISDLVQVNPSDIRKEGDVLTHTPFGLSDEKNRMLNGVSSSLEPKFRREIDQLNSKLEEWAVNNLFDASTLTKRMQKVAAKKGVKLGSQTTECMSRALQNYLKQSLEEMVAISQHRCNCTFRHLEKLPRRQFSIAREPADVQKLRPIYDHHMMKNQQKDVELRRFLIDEAQREEAAEKERSKRRKKSDKNKTVVEEARKLEDMDIEEVAVKDLKARLVSSNDAAKFPTMTEVNPSVPTKNVLHGAANRITSEDAIFWLHRQIPKIDPKTFCQMDMAVLMTGK